jgi:hypothetical protein
LQNRGKLGKICCLSQLYHAALRISRADPCFRIDEVTWQDGVLGVIKTCNTQISITFQKCKADSLGEVSELGLGQRSEFAFRLPLHVHMQIFRHPE